MWDRSRKLEKKRGKNTQMQRVVCMCVYLIEFCQKDEWMDSERQDYDDMPQVCVARHKMKV